MATPQAPAGAPQPPYYAYTPTHAGPPMMINKRLVFLIVAFGILLIWIALLGLRAFDVADPGLRDALRAVYYTGSSIGIVGSLLGALGSPRTDGWQNLGLLILAAVFVTVTVSGI